MVFGGRTAAFLGGKRPMRRGLLIVAVFILVAVSGQDAHAAKFGTKTSYQHLQDLTGKGPRAKPSRSATRPKRTPSSCLTR